MPVRLRIALLFTILVVLILGMVCGSVYYFSYSNRIQFIKTRLTNRAITTARLLSNSQAFNRRMIERIDSLTTLSLKNKAVVAYDYRNQPVYSYSDNPAQTIQAPKQLLEEARVNGSVYFTVGNKDAIGYHYTDASLRVVMVVAAEDVEGKASLQGLRRILLYSFLGGILIAVAGGYFFSRGLLRPVKKISHEVQHISAHNLSRRIAEGRVRDEWHLLTTTLNDLLNRLHASFEQQKIFVANASHELSTPLTAISSQLEVLLQRSRTVPEYEQTLHSVLEDVRQLNRLVRVLLEFAKASEERGGLAAGSIRVDELLLRLPASVAHDANRYQVLLSFEGLPEDESRLLVYGNEDLLFTALRNLTVNACKYADDHTARVTLRYAAAGLEVSVRNNGQPIPADSLPHIFQPFFRARPEDRTEGFGLGLALVDRIVRLHKGSISVSSGAAQGTEFLVRFPQS